MMGRLAAQEQLFYQFRLEDHIPSDHLLRRIDELFDFAPLRPRFADLYSPIGRPSIDPELMIRMLLAGYLYGLLYAGDLGPGRLTLCNRRFRRHPSWGDEDHGP